MLFILLIYFYLYGKVLLHNTCCPSYRDYTIMYWMGCCTNENWIATVIKTIPCACTANSLKPVVVPYTSFQGSCQSPRALCQLLNTEHCDYFHSDTELRKRWAMGCSWASHKCGGGEYEWCVIPARMLQSLAECLKVWWRQTWRTTLVKSHPTSVASPLDWQIWVNKFSFNQLFFICRDLPWGKLFYSMKTKKESDNRKSLTGREVGGHRHIPALGGESPASGGSLEALVLNLIQIYFRLNTLHFFLILRLLHMSLTVINEF